MLDLVYERSIINCIPSLLSVTATKDNHIEVFPHRQVAEENRTIIITCFSKMTPEWSFNGVKLNESELVLVIERVQESHAGVYYCSGVNKFGDSFNSSSILVVNCEWVVNR